MYERIQYSKWSLILERCGRTVHRYALREEGQVRSCERPGARLRRRRRAHYRIARHVDHHGQKAERAAAATTATAVVAVAFIDEPRRRRAPVRSRARSASFASRASNFSSRAVRRKSCTSISWIFNDIHVTFASLLDYLCVSFIIASRNRQLLLEWRTGPCDILKISA